MLASGMSQNQQGLVFNLISEGDYPVVAFMDEQGWGSRVGFWPVDSAEMPLCIFWRPQCGDEETPKCSKAAF